MKISIEIRRPAWMTPTRLRRARPLLLLLALVFAGPVLATDRFTDVFDTNPHHDDISAIAAVGITQGCNPPTNNLYCPEQVVTRQQMGSFLARTAGLGTNPPVTNADKLDGLDSTDFYADGAKVADSELLDGIDSAAFQRRVSGTCVAGSSIRVVTAGGTVSCETDDDTTYTGSHPIEVAGGSIGLSTERCERGDFYKFAVEDEGWSCVPDEVDGGDAETLDGMDSSVFASQPVAVRAVLIEGGPDDPTLAEILSVSGWGDLEALCWIGSWQLTFTNTTGGSIWAATEDPTTGLSFRQLPYTSQGETINSLTVAGTGLALLHWQFGDAVDRPASGAVSAAGGRVLTLTIVANRRQYGEPGSGFYECDFQIQAVVSG